MVTYAVYFVIGLIFLAIFKVKFTFWNALGAGICAVIVFGSGVLLAGSLSANGSTGGSLGYLLILLLGLAGLYGAVKGDRLKKAQEKKPEQQ